jgi:hypothetical protein
MAFLTLDQLPFVGMLYEFVGETQEAPFSANIVAAKPASPASTPATIPNAVAQQRGH